MKKLFLESVKRKTTKKPWEIVAKARFTALSSLREPAFCAVLFVVVLLYAPNSASAASGGIMGGGFFSSSENNNEKFLPEASTSSLGYSPNILHERIPMVTNNYYCSSRKYSPDRCRAGCSSQDQEPIPKVRSSCLGNTGSTASHNWSVGTWSNTDKIFVFIIAVTLLGVVVSICLKPYHPIGEASILTLQVGLLGSVRSLQKDLNRIAESADTSKKEGLTYILKETTLAILRHSAFCMSSYSCVEIKSSIDNCEKRFNQLSFEERVKFDEETLANLNNIKKKTTSNPRRTRFSDEYIVITMLVAIKGVNKLHAIRSSNDLKKALKKLGSICSNTTLGIEVMWTPQDEEDTLTEREYVKDYPLLRPLM